MCDFVPGDEVICVLRGRSFQDMTEPGKSYVVQDVFFQPYAKEIALVLSGVDPGAPGRDFWGHHPHRFRKIIRRDLSAWLETATDFEEPKRAPVNA